MSNLARWLRRKFQGFRVAKHRTQGGEILLTLAVDWRASAVRDEEAVCVHEVADVSIVAAGRWSAVNTFSRRQPSGLNKL